MYFSFLFFCDNFLIPSGYKNRKYYFRKVMPKMEPMVNRQILSQDSLVAETTTDLMIRSLIRSGQVISPSLDISVQ